MNCTSSACRWRNKLRWTSLDRMNTALTELTCICAQVCYGFSVKKCKQKCPTGNGSGRAFLLQHQGGYIMGKVRPGLTMAAQPAAQGKDVEHQNYSQRTYIHDESEWDRQMAAWAAETSKNADDSPFPQIPPIEILPTGRNYAIMGQNRSVEGPDSCYHRPNFRLKQPFPQFRRCFYGKEGESPPEH